MTTATKSRAVAERAVALPYVEADKMLLEHDPNAPFTWEEKEMLRRAGILDALDEARELGRVVVVKGIMARCRPKREREANQIALTKAKAARNQTLPDLEVMRAEIDAKIAALNAAVDEAQAPVAEAAANLSKLREVNPRFVRDEYEVRLSAATFKSRCRRSEIQTELESIERLSNTASIDQQALLHCQATGLNLINQRQPGGVMHVDDYKWQQYVERRQQEKPALLRELDQVEAEIQAATRDCEKMLDFYVDQVG